jgi:hypothetical protein
MSNLLPWDVGHDFGNYQQFNTLLGSRTAAQIGGETASALAGAIRYDSTNNRLRWSNGAAWQSIYPQTDTLDQNTVPVRGAGGVIKLPLTNGSFFVGNESNEAAVTAKSSIPISGFGAATANVAFGSHRLTGVANAVNADEAPNLGQVQNLVAGGIKFKDPARVATTANITLSGTQTIDGISLNVDDRVLVKDQNTAAENGIYLVKSGSWVRAADMPTAGDWNTFVPGAYVFVVEGTTNGATAFIVTSPVGGTIDTDPIDWAIFSVSQTYLAGNGIVIVGNTIHFANAGSYTSGGVFFASSGSSVIQTDAGTDGQILVGQTSDFPVWRTVSGDATINSANGAVTVASGAITLAKMANADALSVIANATNSAATPTYLAAANDGQVLRRSGAALAFGAVNLASPNAVTGRLAFASLPSAAAHSVIGRAGTDSGDLSAIAASNEWQVLRRGSTGLEFGAVNLSESAAVAGTLPIARGGTGTTSWFNGAVVLGAGTGLGQLAYGTSGNVLTSQGTGNAPIWSQLSVSSVTGVLPVPNGGTGVGSYAVGDLLFANTTTSLTRLAIGSNQFVLKAVSGSPQWGTVESDGITSSAVTESKIATSAVTESKIADNAVTSIKILANAVTTAKIQDAAVTLAKLIPSASGLSVIGRPDNSAGQFSEITAGSNHLVLRRSGSTIGFGAIDIGQTAATTGVLPVSRGGTGLSSFTAGTIPVGNGTSPLHTSSSLVWDISNSRLGVAQANPAVAIHTSGSIRADSQLILPVTTGTAPMQVTSRTRVANLNVDQLDGADVGNLAPAGGVAWVNPTYALTTDAIVATMVGNAIGIGDLTAWCRFVVPTTNPTVSAFGLALVQDGANRISFIRIATNGDLQVGPFKANDSTLPAAAVTNIVGSHGGRVVDVVVVREGGTGLRVFLDGALVQTLTGVTNLDVNFTAAARFVVNGPSETSSQARINTKYHRAVLFNRALSAAEAASLTVNGVDPADQWGAQVNQITGAAINSSESDRQFSSFTASGTDGFTATYDATNGSNRAGFPIAANLVRGKRYRFRGVANTNSVAVQVTELTSGTLLDAPVLTSAITINTSSAAPFVKEFTWNGTDTITHVGFHTNASGRSGNLVVSGCAFERIGAVIDLDLGRGYGTTFPDRSTNLLDGVGSGALVHVLPRRRETGASFHGNLPGSGTSFTITHDLGTQNVIVQVWRNATPSGTQTQLRGVLVETVNANQIAVKFGSSVTGSDYRVAILALE